VTKVEGEIAEAFRFAKASPFPGRPDWTDLNWSAATPEADRLLAEVDLAEFDPHQAHEQAKGY
jgi:hypothetical protein